MKKIMILAVALVAGVCANAQTEYSAAKGDWSTEVQFNPFGNNGKVFSLDALKVRYNITDKDAIFIDFGINGVNNKSVADKTIEDCYSSNYSGDFTLNLGYERTFYTYKRIGLYAGGKIGVHHTFAGAKQSADSNNWIQYIGSDNNGNVTATGLNFGVFTGINFTIYKGLYCGAELGFKMTDDVISDKAKTKTCVDGKVETSEPGKSGGHNFVFNTAVQPLIRLGWRF